MNRHHSQGSQKLWFVPSLPRWIAKQHFVEHDSDRPDIALCRVRTLFKDLRRHVYWTAHAALEHLGSEIVNILRESEICDFVDAVLDENVGRLQVSVDNFFLHELCEAREDLPDHVEGFIFAEAPTLDKFAKIASGAELGDDVQAVLAGEHVSEAHDVGMVEALHEVDLGEDCVFEVAIVGEGLQVDFLDGNVLLGLIVLALIDLAVNTLAKAVACLVTVVTDHLNRHLAHCNYNSCDGITDRSCSQ